MPSRSSPRSHEAGLPAVERAAGDADARRRVHRAGRPRPVHRRATWEDFRHDRSRPLAAAIALLLWARPALAQTPVTLSLEEAVTRALEQAPRVAEARAREAAAERRRDVRKARRRARRSTATAGYTAQEPCARVRRPARRRDPAVSRHSVPLSGPCASWSCRSSRRAGSKDSSMPREPTQRAAASDRRTVEEDLRLDVARAYWHLVVTRHAEQVLVQARRARGCQRRRRQGARGRRRAAAERSAVGTGAARARVRPADAGAQGRGGRGDGSRAADRRKPPGTRIVDHQRRRSPVRCRGRRWPARRRTRFVARARERRPERAGLLERQEALRRRRGSGAGGGAAAGGRACSASNRPGPNQRFFPLHREVEDGMGSQRQPDLARVRQRPGQGRPRRRPRAGGRHRAARPRSSTPLVAVDVRRRAARSRSRHGGARRLRGRASPPPTEARRVVDERFQAGVATSTDVLTRELRSDRSGARAAAAAGRPAPGRGARSCARSGAGDGPTATPSSRRPALADVRRVPRRRRRHVRRAPRRGIRLPRQQRRRQVHDDSHVVRPAQADVRPRDRRRHRRRRATRRGEASHRLHVAALLARTSC